MLNVIDKFTRECLAIRLDRKLKSIDDIDVLSDLCILRGIRGHVRIRQRPGIHRKGRARLDRGGGSEDSGSIEPDIRGKAMIARPQRKLRYELR